MKRNVIFGIGEIGKAFVDKCIKNGIADICITDNDPKSWNKNYREYLIEAPRKVLEPIPDLVVMAVNMNHAEEIKAQLLNEFNIPEERIAFWTDIIFLSGDEIYNCGDMEIKHDPAGTPILVQGRELQQYLDNTAKNDLSKFFFEKRHKGMTKWLHYFEAYDRFFSRYRGKDVTILEIGVLKGGSLQMWENYFKVSDNKIQVYGIDINPECKRFESENIKIYIGSQEDREFLRKVKSDIGKVDILIDDGGHTMSQQIVTFEELFNLVADDGVYLCEDLHTSYMKSFGGEYKGDTFIEYSKNLIDYLHAQYSEVNELRTNEYSEKIKFITYCDSMIFIEKKGRSTSSISLSLF